MALVYSQFPTKEEADKYFNKFKIPEPKCEIHGVRALDCKVAKKIDKFVHLDENSTIEAGIYQFKVWLSRIKSSIIFWYHFHVHCSHSRTKIITSEFFDRDRSVHQCYKCKRRFTYGFLNRRENYSEIDINWNGKSKK